MLTLFGSLYKTKGMKIRDFVAMLLCHLCVKRTTEQVRVRVERMRRTEKPQTPSAVDVLIEVTDHIDLFVLYTTAT